MEIRCGELQYVMTMRLLVYVGWFIHLLRDSTPSYRNHSIDCIANQSTSFYMRETFPKKG